MIGSLAEPTLRDLMTDPLVRSVMRADRVDPRALEAMLRSLAVRAKPARKRLPPLSAVALCGTGCPW